MISSVNGDVEFVKRKDLTLRFALQPRGAFRKNGKLSGRVTSIHAGYPA